MRILFISSTRVGDAVLSTGLLAHLIETNPGARITVACGPAAAGLFEAVPGLERVIVLEKMVFSLHWLRLWVLSVGKLWNLVVDLRNAPVSYILPAMRQRHFSRSREMEHRLIELARVLNLQNNPPPPHLWTGTERDEQARQLIADGTSVLAVGPTANWRAKTWRAEFFAELCLRITGPDGVLPGGRIALFGRDDERPQVISLFDALPAERTIDLIGRVELLDIAACLKRCAFYVGNDSGLMHMAAAAGIPTLGLFGPSREELYAPWGENCASVRTPESFDDIHPDGFDHRSSDSLMDSLTVDRVEDAVAALWRRRREAA